MSVEQYQNKVNSLDDEISRLEKRKSQSDKKASDERTRASKVSISKNASESTIRSKLKEIEKHKSAAIKAEAESADYQKKISEKRAQRKEAYKRLQKEQANQRKKEQRDQEKTISEIQNSYERRIRELESQLVPNSIYIESESDDQEYDVFVSHAWEDKESFVDDLVKEMRELGIRVWYDTNEMKWGDSMRQRMDSGLRASKFGIAVLSPDYIADNKYWTKAELDGLFQLESVKGKTILPIWHNLTKQQVMDFSPIIANKKAMTTASMTPHEIAEELFKLL